MHQLPASGLPSTSLYPHHSSGPTRASRPVSRGTPAPRSGGKGTAAAPWAFDTKERREERRISRHLPPRIEPAADVPHIYTHTRMTLLLLLPSVAAFGARGMGWGAFFFLCMGPCDRSTMRSLMRWLGFLSLRVHCVRISFRVVSFFVPSFGSGGMESSIPGRWGTFFGGHGLEC